MFKIGDIVIVTEGSEYSITIPGTIGVVTYLLSPTSVDITIKEFPKDAPEYVHRHVGTSFDVSTKYLRLLPSFYGPELPPVNQKIRTMYARQQAKGILAT